VETQILPTDTKKKITLLIRTLIDNVSEIKDWIVQLFDKWSRFAQKEQKEKNKIPLKTSSLQMIKRLT
jgi:hypothetical protein